MGFLRKVFCSGRDLPPALFLRQGSMVNLATLPAYDVGARSSGALCEQCGGRIPPAKHCATIFDESGRIVGRFRLMAAVALCQNSSSAFRYCVLVKAKAPPRYCVWWAGGSID